jgi:hypothetical protein
MFCASCGSEYSQKLNYCKQCGAGLFAAEPPRRVPRISLASMFWAVAAFSASSLAMCFVAYAKLADRGLRSDELMIPFLLSLAMAGFIALLLIWQLSRLVTLARRQGLYESPASFELPTAQQQRVQSAMPPGQIPSAVEHTTRHIVPSYRERAGHE